MTKTLLNNTRNTTGNSSTGLNNRIGFFKSIILSICIFVGISCGAWGQEAANISFQKEAKIINSDSLIGKSSELIIREHSTNQQVVSLSTNEPFNFQPEELMVKSHLQRIEDINATNTAGPIILGLPSTILQETGPAASAPHTRTHALEYVCVCPVHLRLCAIHFQ